jgi:hypothetical protein
MSEAQHGSPVHPGAHAGDSNGQKHHDVPDRGPALQRIEAVIDLPRRDLSGDQLIQQQPAIERGVAAI